MKFVSLIAGVVFVFIGSSESWGHPVSFEGGTSLMSEMNDINQEMSLIYSPKWYLGTGLIFDRRTDMRDMTSFQLAYLAKRWNQKHAQGNLYFFGGPGYAKLNQETNESFYRFGVRADYETRRIYTAVKYYENRYAEDSELIYSRLRLAAGFAPYIANYDELNSWVILRMIEDSSINRTLWVPTLRFFYKNFLWEIGQDFQGNQYLNFMVRF